MATATRTVLFTDLAGYTARVSRADVVAALEACGWKKITE